MPIPPLLHALADQQHFTALGIAFSILTTIAMIILAYQFQNAGWNALSRHFGPVPNKPTEFTSRSATLYISSSFYFTMSYRSCICVRIGTDGIYLSGVSLFRFFCPPILIPWSAVSECRRENCASLWTLFATTTIVHLSTPNTRLLFTGKLGERLYNYWLQEITHTPPQPSQPLRPSANPSARST